MNSVCNLFLLVNARVGALEQEQSMCALQLSQLQQGLLTTALGSLIVE